jgi:hypothetical protein
VTQASKGQTDGEVVLYAGDREVARKSFTGRTRQALVLDVADAEKLLQPGKNELRLEVSGESELPYTLTWSYRTLQPPSAEGCLVRLATTLDRTEAAEGDTVRLTVTLENTTDTDQGMVTAVVGLPAGLGLPEDMKQLKEHARLRADGQEPGLISAWEVRGRELILYWRGLGAGERVRVPLDLICQVPGAYRGPASRAYLYYNADLKCWVEPLRMVITPRTE